MYVEMATTIGLINTHHQAQLQFYACDENF